MQDSSSDPITAGEAGPVARRRNAAARTLLWITLGLCGAVSASAAAANVGIEPAKVLVPAAAALVVAVVFALRPAAGMATFLLVALTAQTTQRWLNADLQYFDEIAVILLVLISGAMNWARIVEMRPGWKEGALALAVGAGVVSSVAGSVPLDTWIPAMFLFVKGIAFFYAVTWLQLDVDEVEQAGAAILLFAGLVFILGLVEMAAPDGFQRLFGLAPFHDVRGGLTVVKSIFVHPALFGWFTAFASLLLYARFVVFREWWALAAAVVLNVGTLLSGRRRPVIGVFAALVVGVLWVWRQRSSPRAMVRIVAPIAAGLVVVFILTAPFLSGFYAGTLEEYLGRGDLGSILSADPDVTVIAGSHPRMALYVGSLAVARDYFPLGAGLGRYGSYMSEVHYSPVYDRYGLDAVYGLGPEYPVAISDTFWPMVLGEFGPLGVLGIGTFLGILIVTLWRIASETESLKVRAIALGGLFVFVEGLLGSLTAATYVAPPIAYYVFGAAAVAIAAARISPVKKVRGRGTTTPPRGLTG